MVAKTASIKTADETSLSLEQQENLQIKGSKARNVVMQKLLRKSEVTLSILCNVNVCLCFQFCIHLEFLVIRCLRAQFMRSFVWPLYLM